jgi:hypothetical protein
MTIEDATQAIRAAYQARSLPITADSELEHLLSEIDRFETATRDLAPGATDAETDEAAIQTGATLLRGVRLADSIALLVHHRVPKITETLQTLAGFKHGTPEHEAQFDESEYELHVASQFVGFRHRVSFVQAKAPSRYQQRVEFRLGYKWPVECKRPRSAQRVMENIDKTIAKIDERQQPGLVGVGLEAALPMGTPFLEVEEAVDAAASVSTHLGPWLTVNREAIQQKLAAGWARFLIVTYIVRTYMHGNEDVALPSLRLGLSSEGEWVTTAVTQRCLEALQEERAAKAGGGSA